MRVQPVHSAAAGRSRACRARAAAATAPGARAPGRRCNPGRHWRCLPPHTTSQAVVEEQQQQSQLQQGQQQPEDVLSLLQASMPAESSLQQLLEPLLPVEQQPHMPGDDVAEIAAPSSTSLTVGGGSAATSSSTASTQLIDVEAREVPRSWRRTHAPAEPAAAAAVEQPSAPFIVSPAGVAEQVQPQQLLQQQLLQQQQAAAAAVAQQQQQNEEAAQQQQQQQTAMHWGRVVGVCGFAALLCYLDRTNISTAIVPMAEQYGWNKQFCSVVMSAFFAGYGATQVLGGQLSDKFGGSAVLVAGLVGWSLATVLTPLAASAGMWPLLAARAVLGMAQGIAFPAIHALLAKKVPSKVRSGAIGIIMALAHCGTAIGFGASPAIIQGLGWGWTFYIFGGASLLWLVSWAHMERDRGTNNARATAAAFINFNRRKAESGAAIVEAAAAAVAPLTGGGSSSSSTAASNNIVSSARLSAVLRPVAGDGADGGGSSSSKAAATAHHPILEALEQQQQQQQQRQEASVSAPAAAATTQQQQQSAAAAASVPYGFWPLMRRREVWAIAVAQYAAGWGFYGLLAWLPQFFIAHLGVSLSQLGGFTLAPYLAQAVFGSTAGLLADNLITKRKWAIRDVRVLMQVTGMLGPAACLFAAASPYVHSPYVATGLITLGMGLSALTCAGVSASHLEVAPRHAGVIFGVGNTAGTLAGLVAVPGLGYVLQHTGNWSLAFGLAAVHNVIGAVLWAKWVGDKPLPEDGPPLPEAALADAPRGVSQQPATAAVFAAAEADGGAGHMKLKAA